MATSRAFVLLPVLLAMAPIPAAAQGPASAPATVGTQSFAPYRINPGDEIQVFVWGEERLQRTAKILPDGSFSFPLVGRIEAVGKLTTEIEATISKALQTQYRGDVPQVTVSVTSPAGLQFSIIGKVRSPGTFTPGRYVNVLEAMALAGGPADFAQLQNIMVIRKDGEKLSTFRVRLGDLLKGSPSSDDLTAERIPQIRSGDTVIVP
jgi:polysaccharide export outer membrane protein